jgi:hypothetical protein
MADFLNPFKADIEKVTDAFEKHIIRWCIENYVPLCQFNQGEILVVFYENLLRKPKEEVKRIFSFLGGRAPDNILDVVSIPSKLSWNDSSEISGSNAVNSWRKHITDRQVDRAVEVLSVFGLERIYSHDNFPIVSENEAIELFST